MRREFSWLTGLLWGVSIVGYLIFVTGIIVLLWGVEKFMASPGSEASVLDLMVIGFFAFSGLIVGTVMQVFRVAVSLNDKALKKMEQVELLDVRIRSVVPQNRQLKQLDSLKDLVEVNREMLDNLKSMETVQKESKKGIGTQKEDLKTETSKQTKSGKLGSDPVTMMQRDQKWECPNCHTENPAYLFKCRECGEEVTR
ncbi:MAG: hypothetical protein K9N11_07790 [Lentisphaeria bacterium]|nr:hypothetical protein [Lentisphaeria bacterium]